MVTQVWSYSSDREGKVTAGGGVGGVACENWLSCGCEVGG